MNPRKPKAYQLAPIEEKIKKVPSVFGTFFIVTESGNMDSKDAQATRS